MFRSPNPGDVTEQDARGMVVHARDGLDLLTPFTTDDGPDPDFTTFRAAQPAHLMTLFTSPDGDRDALVQQLWDTILACEAEPPSWLLSNMLPDPGDDGSHNNIPKWDNS